MGPCAGPLPMVASSFPVPGRCIISADTKSNALRACTSECNRRHTLHLTGVFGKSGMKCADLLQQDSGVSKAALQHPFLQACSDGSIRPSQFNTWLEQDFNFVNAFAKFAEKVRAVAPHKHARVYIDGSAALAEELTWFKEKLKERNLIVGGPLHATCAAYIDLLAQFEQQSYPVQAVAFWLIEYVYYKAWNLASPVAEPYREFADRWGNAEFAKYVDILEQQADEAMQDADQKEQESIKEAAMAILIVEQRFWQMAMEAA